MGAAILSCSSPPFDSNVTCTGRGSRGPDRHQSRVGPSHNEPEQQVSMGYSGQPELQQPTLLVDSIPQFQGLLGGADYLEAARWGVGCGNCRRNPGKGSLQQVTHY